MSQKAIDIYEAAIDLPEAEFVELLRLFNGPGALPRPTRDPAFVAELHRRVEEYRNGTAEVLDWDVVCDQVDKHLDELEADHGKD